MLRSCTEIASKPDRPCNEKYSCCKCVKAVHFVFYESLSLLRLKNCFVIHVKVKFHQFNTLSTWTLCCHCVNMPEGSHFMPQNEKKNAPSTPPLLLILYFLEFLKASQDFCCVIVQHGLCLVIKLLNFGTICFGVFHRVWEPLDKFDGSGVWFKNTILFCFSYWSTRKREQIKTSQCNLSAVQHRFTHRPWSHKWRMIYSTTLCSCMIENVYRPQ